MQLGAGSDLGMSSADTGSHLDQPAGGRRVEQVVALKTRLSQRHYKSFSNTQQIRSVSTVLLPGMRQKVGR